MSKFRCFFGLVTDETSILLSEQSFFETQLTLSGLRLMICKLFVFRHAETFDNSRGLFSGWRDSELTLKELLQAQGIAEQLKRQQIDYAFTSHLRRARKTLEIVLQDHPQVPIFTADRLIERCYGLLQGEHKRKIKHEKPGWYVQIHRGYGLAPSGGESMEMVEKRVIPFLEQLRDWLKQNPGNVAIFCHNNSIRHFRRVFENLSIVKRCRLESPQDCAIIYEIQQGDSGVECPRGNVTKTDWRGIVISRKVKLATDALNLLKIYY